MASAPSKDRGSGGIAILASWAIDAALQRGSPARARRTPLYTAVTLVSSAFATSEAGHSRTSQRTNIARCRGGSTWTAVRNARPTVSRRRTDAAGSLPPGPGASHESGAGSGQPSSSSRVAVGRRRFRSSRSRQAFVAIRNSQGRAPPWPRRRSRFLQALPRGASNSPPNRERARRSVR